MDDMQAFEREIAGVIQRAVGPARPVDAMAVARAASAQSPRWRFRSMFDATKLIVAGAIVALFGGFLLVGGLTQPRGEDVAPAAVSASPSPTTTEEPLSGMVTEEIEPGVFWVINDGVRDLAYPPRSFGSPRVDVTPDSSVWLSANDGKRGLFRRGEEPVFEGVEGFRSSFREVAPDGSLWAIDHDWDFDRVGIFSFDGEGRAVRATTTNPLSALAAGPDGTVWVVAEDHDEHCPDADDDDLSGRVPAFDQCRGPTRGVTEGTTTGGDSLPLAGAVPPCVHGIRSGRR